MWQKHKIKSMSIKTDYLLKALHIISWIIFIGVSIDAGGVLTNAVYIIFFNPSFANRFWARLDLSQVYAFNQTSFVTLTILMSIVTMLKATLFYIIVKIFHDKKINLSNPFTEGIGRYISNIAYLALGIGLFSLWGAELSQSLVNQQVKLPQIQDLQIGGADVWFFMGFTLLVFAKIFKKGIDLQSEINLTV